MLDNEQFQQTVDEAADATDALNAETRDCDSGRAVQALAAHVIEQIWWQAETGARQRKLAAMPNWGERFLHQQERNAIEALINYQAENTGISGFAIETDVLKLFGADGIEAIKAWNFDEIIRYLTEYEDELGRKKTSIA